MLRYISYSGLSVSILLLAACAAGPNQLGFSQAQWDNMNRQQQRSLLAEYNSLKEHPYQIKTVYDGPAIQVYVLNGEAFMPPFVQPYALEATSFNMQPGECRWERLESTDTNKSVMMRACYDGLYLSLDPSPYDKDKQAGTVHFAYNPLWKRGFTYSSVNSMGYVRLHDVAISIKAIPDHAQHT